MHKEKILVSFAFSVNFDIDLSMISLIKMTWILSLLEGGIFFVSSCSTFGICLFLSFITLVVILIFNTLSYFRSIKIYFDWICYANLSLKWIAWLDLIKFFINFNEKFILGLYNFENLTFLF